MPRILPVRRALVALVATLLVVGLVPQVAHASDAPLVPVVIQVEDAPLASYRGGVPGLAPTTPEATGQRRLDPTSDASRRYLAHLDGRFDRFEREIGSRVPRATVTDRFDVVLGGVAAQVPADSLDDLRTMPGVVAVTVDEPRQLVTDRAPEFIGAPATWTALGGQADAGEGVTVGVIDSGIWPEHDSFSDPDPAGESYPTPPPPPSGVARKCEFGSSDPDDPKFACNDKLIGAYRFMDTWESAQKNEGGFDSARDNDGHGTHTASTAAGNGGVDAVMGGHSLATVSGIAPRAHVIAYKVCGTKSDGSGGCYLSDSVDAVQQAVLDGVDVINFSIDGGTNPYTDPVEQAFQDAYAAGTLVSASAGNSGPTADTVSHRGPWTLTVGASTHDRWFTSTATLVGVDTNLTVDVTGTSITAGIGTSTPVVDAADHSNNELCEQGIWPSGTFNGEIVACKQGKNARVAKSEAVKAAGGGGMLLYNVSGGQTGTYADRHLIPSIHLDVSEGKELTDFLDSHSTVTGTFPGGSGDLVRQGDVMARFSSRGGSGQALGISKPDVTAPGVDILAGYTPAPNHPYHPEGEEFSIASGTSMSSPMTAGAAALMFHLHPDWTPGQVRSALMTTATEQVTNHGGGGTTPFDRGSGRIDLGRAGDPGLTFDESAADYDTLRDRLWEANHPSLYHPKAGGTFRVQRTVRSHLSAASTWAASVVEPSGVKLEVPASVEVAAGGTATFEIAANVRALAKGAVRFARLQLIDGSGRVVAFPITLVKGDDLPNTAPEAASSSVGTLTDTSVDVTLQATDADDDLLDHTVVTQPDHGTLSGTAPDLTYTPDEGYTGTDSFTFEAEDGKATSDTATVSISIGSETPPGAPRNVSAAAGDQRVTVGWDAPADDGGSTITSYTVTSSPGGKSVTVDGSKRSATVTGLTNGTSYRFTVTATNGVGTGPGATSDAVTPAGLPGAPGDVAATAGDAKATVSWSAAAPNGSGITSYTVKASPGGRTVTVGGSKRSATLTGLTNGTSYSFTVSATNGVGTGPGATSNRVLPGVRLDGDPATTERIDHSAPIAAAVELSRSRFAHDAAGHVVLSRHDNFADSLAGAALTDRGPLLLTPTGQLDSTTRKELDRVLPGGGTVYVLGGNHAVGPGVEDTLRSAGYRVVRLFGATRIETALDVADEVRRLNPGERRVALARAFSPESNPTAAWADSVTGGAWAADQGVPIVVSTGDRLHDATAAWLASDGPSQTILLGGTAALSDAVAGAVPSPRRIAGATRDGTAAAIARDLWGAPTTGRRDHVIIHGWRTDGWAFGLAAAGLAAQQDAPLLLVHPDEVPTSTAELVSSCGSAQVDLLLIGSSDVISDTHRRQLDALDGGAC